MVKMLPYLYIIRPVNLFIIVLAQVLAREAVFVPILEASGISVQLSGMEFALLVVSSVLIAAAGYVINDVNDTGMDSLNRPAKVIAGKLIPLEKARNYYYLLNISGISTGVILSFSIGKWELSILFLIIATMLYYYTYKYQYFPFWGNFTVSLLAGMTVAIVWLFEFFALRQDPGSFVEAFPAFNQISLFTGAYALFAFLTTMGREIIKDMQDREGDAKNGCRTIPVKYGEKAARRVATLVNIITMAGLVLYQLWLSANNYDKVLYSLVIPQALLIVATVSIFRATAPKHYRKAGYFMKLAMFTGILSMIFVYFR